MSTFDLDARGVAWIRARLANLSQCGDPLKEFCAPLARLMDVGRTWTLAPAETSTDQLYRFERGGLLPQNGDMSRAVDIGGSVMTPIESLHAEERTILQRLLREQVGRVCVMPDPDLTRGDPCISAYHETIAFYVGDKVFHVVDASSDDEDFSCAFDACPFWCNLRVVTSESLPRASGHDLSLEQLRRSAAGAVAVSCSAYDGEGFVVWQREI